MKVSIKLSRDAYHHLAAALGSYINDKEDFGEDISEMQVLYDLLDTKVPIYGADLQLQFDHPIT